MADNKTDYLETAILNHVLRNTAYTSPTSIDVALFTVMPSDDGTGGTEVTGGSYARQSITFAAPSGGAVANSGAVTFPQATADWGTVLGIGLYDGSNLLYYGTMASSKAVGNGDQLTFPASSVTVSES